MDKMGIQQFEYLKILLVKMIDWPSLKMIGASFIAIGGFLFDSMTHDAIIALLILMLFDFITAIIVAYKTGKEIRSARAIRSALKITVYMLLVSSGHLAEVGINVDMFPLNFIDETIIGFLVVTELISIIENAGKMGYAIPNKLLNKLNQYKNEL